MSTGRTPTPDPEDLFAETRMSFGDHLEELRRHLWKAIIGFGVAMIFGLFVAQPVLEFIAKPVEDQLESFYNKRVKQIQKELNQNDSRVTEFNKPTPFVKKRFYGPQLKAFLDGKSAEEVNAFPRPKVVTAEEKKQKESWWGKVPFLGGSDKDEDEEKQIAEGNVKVLTEEEAARDFYDLWVSDPEPLRTAAYMQEAQRHVGKRFALTTLNVQEAFMVYFKVAMVCGLVLGSPWIFYQIWQFIAAGLYPHEKRYVHVYLPFSLFLFLAGVFVCEFFVIPKAIEALLWFNHLIGVEPDLRLNEWLGFAIWMPVIFGLSFQTPLVMLFFERLGIVTVDTYRSKRKIAWMALAIFAAIITPSTDAISMLFLWVPMSLLFELGIFLCKRSPQQPDFGIDEPES